MNKIPKGARVFILGKTIGRSFETTKIYDKGQNFGYVRGWKEEMECYVVRWDNGDELKGDYFMPEDLSLVINKGR